MILELDGLLQRKSHGAGAGGAMYSTPLLDVSPGRRKTGRGLTLLILGREGLLQREDFGTVAGVGSIQFTSAGCVSWQAVEQLMPLVL